MIGRGKSCGQRTFTQLPSLCHNIWHCFGGACTLFIAVSLKGKSFLHVDDAAGDVVGRGVRTGWCKSCAFIEQGEMLASRRKSASARKSLRFDLARALSLVVHGPLHFARETVRGEEDKHFHRGVPRTEPSGLGMLWRGQPLAQEVPKTVLGAILAIHR